MKKNILLIFFALLFINAFAQKNDAQKIDSLKIELKNVKIDTAKINILNEISRLNFYTDPNNGIEYAETALDLSAKIKWKKGMAVACNHLGICNQIIKKQEKSIEYFKKSLFHYKELKDLANISDNYNHLGILYTEIEKYSQALTFLNEAYKINIKIGNVLQTANDLNGIGDIYYKTGNYQKAIDNYITAHQKFEAISNVFGMGLTSFSIGKTYVLQKKYAKALEYYNIALNKFTEIDNSYHIGNTYLEMGKTYRDYSFEKKKEKRKNLLQAIKSLKQAIHFYADFKKFDKVNECYIVLSKTYEEIGDYKQALDSYKNYVQIDQTLLTYEKENKLAELKTQREFEAKNSKIETQELKIESDRRKVYLLLTAAGSITILLLLFLWLYLSKRKTNQLLLDKNEEISNINKQKDKFFSIIAHDLRGPFNGFLGLSELLANEIDDMDKDEIQFAATSIKKSAGNLNNLLENLLEWSRMEQGLIPFSPKEYNLLEAVKECTATLQDASNKKEISIETKINESLKIYADPHILQSVIRNILSNAVKFTPKKGTIKIQGNKIANNTIVSISDTGIGMNAKMLENIFQIDVKTNRKGTDDEPSSGLGLILCKEFIEKHDGEIWIESLEGKGSTINFSFPENFAAEAN